MPSLNANDKNMLAAIAVLMAAAIAYGASQGGVMLPLLVGGGILAAAFVAALSGQGGALSPDAEVAPPTPDPAPVTMAIFDSEDMFQILHGCQWWCPVAARRMSAPRRSAARGSGARPPAPRSARW